LCPGGVCEVEPAQSAGVNLAQIAVVLVFASLIFPIAQWVYRSGPEKMSQAPQTGASTPITSVDPAEAERCKVPDFAKAIGHEEQWKLHNHCK